MVRVRFASSPTGSLHLGNALSAVAGRHFADEHGGTLLLRIDDADVEGAVETVVDELEWLGVPFDEGPLRQSERAVRHCEAAHLIGVPDGTATSELASAVDDVDFAITHVLRGSDERASSELQASLVRALGARPPEYIHHGVLLGGASVAELREAGIPAEAVRAYLEELGLPRNDLHVDPARLRRLSIEALARLSDDELAERVGVPASTAPVLRGARDLREAHEHAEQALAPRPADVDARETLERFSELVAGGVDARSIVRELNAVGGDLQAVRLALTGRDRGPGLAALIRAIPRDELLRRAALR
jgi:hypothetical protein